MPSSKLRYRPLNIDDEFEEQYSGASRKDIAQRAAGFAWRRINLEWLTLIICLLCTVANLLPLRPPSTHKPATDAPIDLYSLRRPSIYIGLELVERPVPPIPRSIFDFPFVLTQLDSANPFKVFGEDLKRFLTRSGTVSPDERRFQVTSNVRLRVVNTQHRTAIYLSSLNFHCLSQ